MLRHGSLRDDRRRRSLLEDAAAGPEPGNSGKSRPASHDAETYTARARSECHARWSDFIPLRNWSMAGLLAIGLVVAGILEAGYYFAVRTTVWSTGGIAAIDLAQNGSIAAWWSTLVTLSCAVLALFIYSVRRYRLDDYRGRYRVWLGGGALWTLMSLDGIADLKSAIRTVGVELSGHTGPGNGMVWWFAPWSLSVAWFGLRTLIDVRGCRTAMVSLVLAFCLMTIGFVLPRSSMSIVEDVGVMVTVACWLVGQWLLLFAHMAFARHVLLEAHGRLPIRATKPKREKKKSQSATPESSGESKTTAAARRRDDLTTRIDPPHTKPSPTTAIGVETPRSAPVGAPAGASNSRTTTTGRAAATPAASTMKPSVQFIGGRDDEAPGRRGQKMSRADRKRLRKQQRGEELDDD
jgi:hypothetical protein